jgi:hypothetical protein
VAERSSSSTPGLRPALLAAKLRALVAAGWGPTGPDDVPGTFPGGAALRRDGSGWVLAEDEPARALGPALTWAGANGVDGEDLHVLAAGAAGLLARRAALFHATPSVWRIEGTSLVRAEPDPPVVPVPPPRDAEAFVPALLAAGVEVVVEHGAVAGEVLGLEVARVVDDGSGARLEVGVGRHDRDAQRQFSGDDPAPAVLSSAVAAVRARRRPGAPSHPANQLARERWLRAVVVGRPGLAGAARLAPVQPSLPAAGLRRPAPAAAAGVDSAGRPLVVVCSVGIDLDLVPAAADARLSVDPAARLVLVVPDADAHPVTHRLAAGLVEPAELVTVPDGWEALGG